MSAGAAWMPLRSGDFSRIDWGRKGASDGFDPYLVWAEASGFSGCRLGKTPKWLPVVVELAQGCSIRRFVEAASHKWLRVSAAYTDPRVAPEGLRFCTASIGPGFFRAIAPGGRLDGMVLRFELGLPAGHHIEAKREASGSVLKERDRLKGSVFALVDGGLAFANRAFLLDDRVRTRFFWRQDTAGVGDAPASLGYGHELQAAQIRDAMRQCTYNGLVDEARVYAQFDLRDLRKPANHGTHVASLACGPRELLAGIANLPPHFDAPPSWAGADDTASRCDMVAVQLDWSNVIDTSGGSMNVSILDALMYIQSRCHRTARVVTNVSWGTLAGPHDGTSVLEAAMDQLVALRSGHLDIVVPAGNGYQDRLHANAELPPGKAMHLDWQVQPGDATQSFLEIWLPPRSAGVGLRLHPPLGAPASDLITAGESAMWADADGRPLAAVVFPARVATGTKGTCILVALAPTTSFHKAAVTAPCGRWQVEIRNGGKAPVVVDAYIERDDVALGQNTGARQSRFSDWRYDTSGNPDAFVDKPVPVAEQFQAPLVRRSGTFNSIGTGQGAVAVGGKRIVGEGWSNQSLYSPRDPDPDASRPERDRAVVKVPDRMAWCDENPVLLGLRGAGTFSGGAVRLVGTSGAAPLVSRELLDAPKP